MNTAIDGDDEARSSGRQFHLAICGGGSGGHLTPGIAVAEEIERRISRVTITFLTSSREVDHRVLRQSVEAHEHWAQSALPIFGRGHLKTAVEVLCSVFEARRMLKELKPQVVLGTGGFASVPGILAAATLRIPIFLLECNVVPGRANRLLNRFSRLTFCGLPMQIESRERWSADIEQVGVPLRQHFLNLQEVTESRSPTVLIIGGSQGASGLNELVVSALKELAESSENFRVVHQTGSTDFNRVHNLWGSSANVTVVSYIDDLVREIRNSAVVISRAGAVAMSEISVCARPAIFIPLPNSADQHQLANAEYFVEQGAAVVVEQSADDAAKRLRDVTITLLRDHQRNDTQIMRSMNKLAKPEAVRQIASGLLQYSSD